MSTGHIPTKPIPMVGFVAPSGTGKTTLLRKLVPLLRERGLRVGYLKHTHHAFEIDTPGKDSYQIAEAGAAQVMLASAAGWALMDHRPAAVADLVDADPAEFAARFDAKQLDLLLVEGFHRSRYPKIEVYRSTSGSAPMYPQDADIIAVVTDAQLSGDEHPPELPSEHPPELPLDDPAAVADFIRERLADGRLDCEDPRDPLLAYARRLRGSGHEGGLLVSASVRVGSRFWITPASTDVVDGVGSGGSLRREDLIACAIDDEELPTDMPADVGIHRCVYREQQEARAVLHGHGAYSVAVSFGGRDFQPVDFEGSERLGSVPVLSVDTAEKPDKAAALIGETLAGSPICLLAGHGSYAWGDGLEQATRRTELLERAAKIYVLARQAAAL